MEQRGDALNRSLYRFLNDVELRIALLPPAAAASTDLPSTASSNWTDYYDEWAFLTWNLLALLHRLQMEADSESAARYLDYGGKHFQEKINSALVDLVNKAQRMTPPTGVQTTDPHFDRYYQAYVATLISLHELYTMAQQRLVELVARLGTVWTFKDFLKIV